MANYNHSVLLDISKCKGCTHCLKRCPTEAIRIRNGHAQINAQSCIDCGECIRLCPYNAKTATCDKLESIMDYRYTIALPPPSLYGQFDHLDDIDYIIQGLYDFGFDEVFEVARAAEIVSGYTRRYLRRPDAVKPAISSACPAVSRLIEQRFPSLIENVIPLAPPVDLAARMAREKALAEHPELKSEDIGVCFISPCPAKASYVKNGFADYKSGVDVVVSMSDVYFALIGKMTRDDEVMSMTESGMVGIGWATSGGEATALFNDEYLAADGIENIINVLEQIENGNIPKVKFIELDACTAGCVGGVLTVQNPYIAKTKLQSLRRYLPVSANFLSPEEQEYIPGLYLFDELPTYEPMTVLSLNMAKSMRMMADIQKLRAMLPGIDCGACGAPSCRALAEDIVKGNASLEDCRILEKRRRSK